MPFTSPSAGDTPAPSDDGSGLSTRLRRVAVVVRGVHVALLRALGRVAIAADLHLQQLQRGAVPRLEQQVEQLRPYRRLVVEQ